MSISKLSPLLFFHSKFKEIYEYRSVLKSLIMKNLFGKYKNSKIGFSWHFIVPIFMMIVYYIVFTELRKGALPNYWVYLAAGLFPFNFMLNGITESGAIMFRNSDLIKKIYFPKEILVLSHVLSAFIVMLIGYGIMLMIIVLFGNTISICWIATPIIILLMALFILGVSFTLASISVYIPDLQYIISTLSVAFFLITPMYFTTTNISGALNAVVWANPMTYYIESFHYLIYYNMWPNIEVWLVCIILSFATLIIGTFIFEKLKKGFTERV